VKQQSTMKIFQPISLIHLLLLGAFTISAHSATAPNPAPVINITGADSRLSENIQSLLSIRSERCNSELRRLNRLLPQVNRDIERAAQALGYYHLRHHSEFRAGDACWTLDIEVQPGEPVLLGDIHVNISPDNSRTTILLDPFSQLVASSPLRTGTQLLHQDYEDLKSTLSAVAVENGYFAARFTRSELAIDLSRKRADISIDFDPGVRYHFGDINIRPLDELSEQFIRRFLPFESGSPYSTEALIALRQGLNDSQYFSEVAVTPQLSANQTRPGISSTSIPLNIELGARARRALTTGLGVTTDIGPRLTLNYEDRYINRSGHRQNADMALSPLEQRADISYIVPMSDPATESLNFSTGYIAQNNNTFDTQTYKIGASYRSTVDVWALGDEWLQNIFVNFQRETSTLNTLNEQSRLTISGINWTKTQADDPIFPAHGWRLFTQVSGASNAVLSDLSFMQIYTSAKLVQEIGPGRALIRMEAATSIVDGVEELPVSIRFFTGGDQSVRGYQYGSLGALNDHGEVIGGKHLLTASAEYDFNIRPGWRMAVFYDTGNSFANFDDISFYKSAGLGIRWLSPIGPIRADIAKGLGDGSFRLHITMGPDL
jgi:translocation and assembly module TamA